jgi:hypothetical protein
VPTIHTRIIVADLPSGWRTELVAAIERVERAIRVTESGQELRRALEESRDPPRIVVIGSQLKGLGAFDALYQADRTLMLERKIRPAWPTRSVVLITDVRSDAELLDLFRRRGVNQFVYREDPVERTAAALLSNLEPSSRALVRLDALIVHQEEVMPGAVYDISRSGAQIVLATDEASRPPAVGSRVRIELIFRNRKVTCAAEVRRLSAKSASQGARLILGVQFREVGDDVGYLIDRLITEATEEFEIARQA